MRKLLITHRKESDDGVKVDTCLHISASDISNVEYAQSISRWYDPARTLFDKSSPNTFTVAQRDGPLTYIVDYAWEVDVFVALVDRRAGVFLAQIMEFGSEEVAIPIHSLPVRIALAIEPGSKLSVYTNLPSSSDDLVFDEWNMEDIPEWTKRL